jgi:hypothetical protein
MAIKASGTALTLMSETDGWVEMDVAAVLNVLDRADLAALPVKEREARVLGACTPRLSADAGAPRLRPRFTPCSAAWWSTPTPWRPTL